ncbi:formate dehydrogenase accessory sulfurtransferase FdhD [Geomesophilobacter sediminis]|uniref:Sulfur carrier protein FdhD n=1 Tax=Geomesophilobacter sediminis TaxID=2798584 RepID=A0A8J7JG66_9BACT|nr:formate dehydrogenase accessory sulfurtransferase FdhD [Geomesophilobacter sediminis]MBJ6725574.1 formate dehydrogenase accessory sulfurtransferase FdhD [Geomesophilobacter sediminis]
MPAEITEAPEPMDERLYCSFDMKEIVCGTDTIRLCHKGKDVIGEISLKIFINGTEYASLLCLNQKTEELALGFLYSEGVIDSMEDIASITYNERLFAVMVQLVPGMSVAKCESLRSVTSGCGKCFTYINPLKHEKYLPLANEERFPLRGILEAMDEFERQSQVYRAFGGVHSVLFRHRDYCVFNEDIGRHNCFDKIGGILLKNEKLGLTRSGMLFLSGRVSSEIITKVIRMGVPVLVSRSTPTAAAVNLAREYNVTLLGYVHDRSGFVYAGEERLTQEM